MSFEFSFEDFMDYLKIKDLEKELLLGGKVVVVLVGKYVYVYWYVIIIFGCRLIELDCIYILVYVVLWLYLSICNRLIVLWFVEDR